MRPTGGIFLFDECDGRRLCAPSSLSRSARATHSSNLWQEVLSSDNASRYGRDSCPNAENTFGLVAKTPGFALVKGRRRHTPVCRKSLAGTSAPGTGRQNHYELSRSPGRSLRLWADIRDKTGAVEGDGSGYDNWVAWVDNTGGDPPEKAAKLVLDIIESDVNGRFLWIDDPLQTPIPSWGEDA